MKRFIITIILIQIMVLCGRKEDPIYLPTPQALNLGSLYYANSDGNCKSCHGVDYKGNGPEAKDLGVKVPDFTDAVAPEKTPYDYFMAISIGTKNTVKDGYNYHEFYSYTDAAKWAMANFLYSIAKEPTDMNQKKIKQESYAKKMQEVKEFYKQNRKMYIGSNTPSSEREKNIPLDQLIQKADLKILQDYPYTELSEDKVNVVYDARKEYEEGYHIYEYKCQSCHGIGGEGIQGSKSLGLLDKSRGEVIREIARRKNSFISIPPLTKANVNQNAIQQAHPDVYISTEGWNELINFLNAIVEK